MVSLSLALRPVFGGGGAGGGAGAGVDGSGEAMGGEECGICYSYRLAVEEPPQQLQREEEGKSKSLGAPCSYLPELLCDNEKVRCNILFLS